MTIPVNPMPQETRLYTNITPFTVRDNATYLIVLEEMRQFINTKLVPFINENVSALDQAWVEQTQQLIESWNEQSQELIAQVQAIAEGVDGDVQDAQDARDAAEAARDLAEQYASNVVAYQDDSITQIFEDFDSQFRESFNTVISGLISEDPDDQGTFIVNVPEAPPGA